MDVISPHQAGITNVVASLGTALTEQQGRLLRQYADEIILSYDSDAAGQTAIERGLEVLNSLGVSAKVLQMTGAKDPDEYVLKYGPDRFRKLIDNSISYAEYKIKRLMENYDLENPTDKIKFLTKMSEVLAKIDNNIERDIYVDKFSKELGVGKEAILAEIEKKTLRNNVSNNHTHIVREKVGGEVSPNSKSASKQNEDLIIYLLSKKDESIYKELKSNISVSDIKNDIQKGIISKLYDLYESGQINNRTIDSVCEKEEEYDLLAEVLMNENVNEDIQKILSEVIRNFKLEKLKLKKEELISALSGTITNDERESLELELSNVIAELGRFMIRK